jgi:hypothetical protein
MTISGRSLVLSTFLIFQAGAAWASPNFGSSCTSCHTRADGAFSFLPSNLLQIAPGQTREITINVTDAAPGVTSALSLTGLNASGLGATAGAPWTNRGGWWTLGPFSGTGEKSLNLTLGAGAVTGTYPINVTLAGGSGAAGGRWSRTGSFTVQVAPAGVPGDYNGNGKVDAADYVLWRNGGPLQNEVATVGSVNAADYTAWRARFGNTAGSGAGAGVNAVVPEPATLVLLMLASVGMRLRSVERLSAEGMGLEPTTGFPAPHFQSEPGAEALSNASTCAPRTCDAKENATELPGDARVAVDRQLLGTTGRMTPKLATGLHDDDVAWQPHISRR